MSAPFHLLPGTELAAHLISPGDSVKLAVLAGPGEGIDHSVIFEVWEPGGAQPPNSHPQSVETFFFLAGQGIAESDGAEVAVYAGQLLILPAGTTHRISNPGPGRLYAITTMLPDDGFADLIRAGPSAPLDDDDMRVLTSRVIR